MGPAELSQKQIAKKQAEGRLAPLKTGSTQYAHGLKTCPANDEIQASNLLSRGQGS